MSFHQSRTTSAAQLAISYPLFQSSEFVEDLNKQSELFNSQEREVVLLTNMTLKGNIEAVRYTDR